MIGDVVMPEHFHLLVTEPDAGDASVVMKVIKERFTKLVHDGGKRTGPIWQKRFYDFNVCVGFPPSLGLLERAKFTRRL